MKSNIPWSVKGIDPEAREAAKIAARRAGMTLGEWLNSLILQSGEVPEGLAAQIAAAAHADDDDLAADFTAENSLSDPDENGEDVNDLQSRLENLNRRLDASERQSALAVSGIDQSIERLASTIESSRRLLATGDIAPKVNDLSSRVEQLQRQLEQISTQGRAGLDSRTLIALEKAIAGVANHIEKSDRRNAELVQSVEEAISELTAKVAHAETHAAEAIGRIDLTVDRLGGRMDSAESEQRRSSARLNERLAQLDERLAQSLVQRESGIGGIERRLAGMETRLETVQGQIKAQIDEVRARPILPPEAFSRKEFEDWSRRQAADQGAAQATARQGLANLEARIAVLAERADRLQRDGGGASTAAVERIAEGARLSSERADAAAKRMLEASEGLKREVAELGDRLERSNHTATETMSALSEALQQITRRLDAVETRAPQPAEERYPERPAATAEPRFAERPREAEAAPEPTRPRAEARREVPSKSPGWLWGDEAVAAPATASRTAASAAPEPEAPVVEEIEVSEEEVIEVFEAPPEEAAAEDRAAAAEGKTEGARDFDWGNLLRNLDAGGESAEREPPQQPAAFERTGYERPAPEPAPAEQTEESSWLEQARVAARAGTADHTYDYTGEKPGMGLRRSILLGIGALILAAAIVLLAWKVVPALFKKDETPAQTRSATTTTTAPGDRAPVSPSAVNQKPPSTAGRNEAPETAPPATPPASSESSLSPREEDIGPQEADTSIATPPSAPETVQPSPPPIATAPAPAPATAAKLTPDQAFQAAITAGNPRAFYAQGLSLKGKGATDQAVDAMNKAAAKGLAVADRQLGIWYEQGDGVPKNMTQAAKHYLRAAQGGDIQAMHNLGFFYAQALGGLPKDGATAERWFKNAAQRGLVASQVNLAIVYSQAAAFGLPARSDPQSYANDAYLWAAVAAHHGDEQAERMRSELAKSITPAAKADLDRKVLAWKAQPLDIVANGGFDTNPEAFLPADQQAPLGRDEILNIQELLSEHGFRVAIDGKPGPALETQIKAFQRTYRLPETGVADQDLIAALGVVPR